MAKTAQRTITLVPDGPQLGLDEQARILIGLLSGGDPEGYYNDLRRRILAKRAAQNAKTEETPQ